VQNMAFVAIVLSVGFICQIVWWRLRGPSLSSILVLFAAVYLVLSVACVRYGLLSFSAADYARVSALFASVVLAYTIVCSAVEARSPSLSIITCIAGCGQRGCPEEDLTTRLLAEDAMRDRLRLMEVSGLVHIADGRCTLTGKGAFFAHLFEFGGRVFGVAKGG